VDHKNKTVRYYFDKNSVGSGFDRNSKKFKSTAVPVKETLYDYDQLKRYIKNK
jgi:hypothetical protein